MEIIRQIEIVHSNPPNKPEYIYAQSAKIFNTNQLFLFSEKLGPKKKSSSPHYHRSIDEIAYIIQGEIYAIEEESEVLLKQGDSVLFKANSQAKNFLENRSTEPAEFLLFRRSIKNEDVIY